MNQDYNLIKYETAYSTLSVSFPEILFTVLPERQGPLSNGGLDEFSIQAPRSRKSDEK